MTHSVYTPEDSRHLEIMAELTASEPVPEPKVDLKKLLARDADPVAVSLDQKLALLCSKLHSGGFAKQADSLEAKYLEYKLAAANGLYDVHGETGEDLINAAHPEGEVRVTDSEHGAVETLVTEHKKIVELITKEPLGKLAQAEPSVVLPEIARRFKNFAEYLKSKFVDHMPEGSKVSPQARNFFGLVHAWYDVAVEIAQELNQAWVLPQAKAMELVKNRLLNHQVSSFYAASVNSEQDVDRLINILMQWCEVNRAALPKKKTALHDYVNRCKIVLGQDTVDTKLVNDFKILSKALASLANDIIKYCNNYRDTILPDGRRISDYIERERGSSNSIDDVSYFFSTEWDWKSVSTENFKRVLGHADKQIKLLFNFINQIDKVIDTKAGSKFSDKMYPEKVLAQLNPLREAFMSIFTRVHGDNTAADWHEKFFNFQMFNELVNSLNNEELSSIVTKIDRHILSNEDIKKESGKLYGWFEIEKSYINGFSQNLSKLASAIDEHVKTVKPSDLSKLGLIDVNMLKGFAEKISKDLTTDLDFSSKEKLFQSINHLPTMLLADCFKVVSQMKLSNQDLKSRLLDVFKVVA